MNDKILPRSFYVRPTVQVAIDLLGKVLVHGTAAGKIVETEAYLQEDPASHSTRRKTERTRIIWGKPGVAYIYLNYGMHYCLNIVTEREGAAGCVLIRALEPTSGISIMQKRRNTRDPLNLASGPGKLTRALGITTAQYAADVTQGNLVVLDNKDRNLEIAAASRIGISKAEDAPLRFFIKDSRFVSHPKRGRRFLEGSPRKIKEAFGRGGRIIQG
jgi:DNA-3-methyladenine glycosylase